MIKLYPFFLNDICVLTAYVVFILAMRCHQLQEEMGIHLVVLN